MFAGRDGEGEPLIGGWYFPYECYAAFLNTFLAKEKNTDYEKKTLGNFTISNSKVSLDLN